MSFQRLDLLAVRCSRAVTSNARWLVAVVASTVGGAACAGRPLPAAPEAEAPADASSFLAVVPCPTELDYVTGTHTVTFGFLGSPPGVVYDPKCLATGAGEIVTFTGSFVAHPLYPSATRGTVADNPIDGVSAGDSKAITFPSRGFFAYYCGVHGASDDRAAMAGVVWVR